ncbi:exodeoxyribonuclease VII small subunit [uncultured Selenomonas sp.]|uniref:exodeoxyribonuclease VII small subunit n=1 Tax=uncultured Selenomonas sp. TaxID=159275 RepID=UPI0025FDF3F9|nr:exodeoxyribonuclease VII small subunit [uncultured Selenomonas sp.]
MPRKKEPTFEEALARLNTIVETMEQGDLPLKELIAQYSEGMQLAATCSQSLARAEQAMDLLVENQNGEAVTRPLTIEEGN